ncbi:MAG: MFS transporter [Bifidobacteriaceae bacterium]|jgi:MFS family permease|nr:MFS transporter [Bifidobacteriaceae bacterium]
MARSNKLSAALIVVCQSLQTLSIGGVSLFLPLIRADLGLTFAQAGFISSAALFSFALMQIPAGWLADRLGAKRLFTIGLLGVLALTCLLGMLDSYWMVLLTQVLSGVFRSFVFIPGMLLITWEFPQDREATAMGLYVAGGYSSNVLLSSIGPFLVEPFGWRTLFVVFGLAGCVAVFGYAWAGGPGPPRQGGAAPPLRRLGELLARPVFVLAAWLQFVRYAIANGVTFWLPSFLVSDHAMSLRTAGIVVAASALLTAPANLVGGYLSDRLRAPARVIAVSLAVLVVSLSIIAARPAWPVLCAAIAVQAIFVQVYFGPLFAVPIQAFGQEIAALSNGYSNLCANIGGLAAAWALGAIRDATGDFAAGFWMLAGLAATGVAAAMALRKVLAR